MGRVSCAGVVICCLQVEALIDSRLRAITGLLPVNAPGSGDGERQKVGGRTVNCL